MLDRNTAYIQNAHRHSLNKVSKNVKEVHSGMLFHLDDNEEWDYADGTRISYPTLNERYPGKGLGPQGERLEGRDNVSSTGKLACLLGNFEIGVDTYEKGATYKVGRPLAASSTTKGYLKPAEDGEKFIVGYVTHVPEDDNDFLRYHRA